MVSKLSEILHRELSNKMSEIEELRQLCEKQRIVIEFLLNAIQAAVESMTRAYMEADSQSTQTGTSEK